MQCVSSSWTLKKMVVLSTQRLRIGVKHSKTFHSNQQPEKYTFTALHLGQRQLSPLYFWKSCIDLPTYLPIFLSTYLPIYLSIYLSTYLSLSICLSIYPSIHLSFFLSVHLFVGAFVRSSVCLSVFLVGWLAG